MIGDAFDAVPCDLLRVSSQTIRQADVLVRERPIERADHGRVVGVRSDVVLIDQEAIRLRTRMAVDVRLQEV